MIMLLLLQKYFYYLSGSKLTKYCPLFEFFNYVLGHFSPKCTKQKQLAQNSRMSCVETKAQAFPEKKSKKISVANYCYFGLFEAIRTVLPIPCESVRPEEPRRQLVAFVRTSYFTMVVGDSGGNRMLVQKQQLVFSALQTVLIHKG